VSLGAEPRLSRTELDWPAFAIVHRRLRKAALGEQLLAELDELALPHRPRNTTVPKVLYATGSLHLPSVDYRE
jgi:hypothetical protein